MIDCKTALVPATVCSSDARVLQLKLSEDIMMTVGSRLDSKSCAMIIDRSDVFD